MRWLLLFALACGGSSGSADSGVDGPDSSTSDTSEIDATTAMDATSDADGNVERIDRVDGPGDSEPDETTLEPGSDADHIYRYCWFLTETFCRGALACCDDDLERFGDDLADCHESLLRSLCDIWPDRPDAVGPQDVEALEANLERLADSADDCGELVVKFVFTFGNLEPGDDCSSEGFNPSFLCAEGAECIDDVCTAYPEIGEACFPASLGNRCSVTEAFCNDTDDICVAYGDKPVGEPCELWGECSTFRCEGGMCVERAESPWCFQR